MIKINKKRKTKKRKRKDMPLYVKVLIDKLGLDLNQIIKKYS